MHMTFARVQYNKNEDNTSKQNIDKLFNHSACKNVLDGIISISLRDEL